MPVVVGLPSQLLCPATVENPSKLSFWEWFQTTAKSVANMMHKSYLSLVPLSAVTKSLTHQLQVTCYIEKILRIRVEYIENCLLTDSQLQFWRDPPQAFQLWQPVDTSRAQTIKLKPLCLRFCQIDFDEWNSSSLVIAGSPFRIIMMIHLISCTFVLLMSSASFAIFSLLQQTRAKTQSTKMSGWIHQELAMVP